MVGLDFGTTNCSIAMAVEGQVRLAQFPDGSASYRSILYAESRKAARAQFAAETARLAELARWPGHPAGAELEGLAAFAAATDAAYNC